MNIFTLEKKRFDIIMNIFYTGEKLKVNEKQDTNNQNNSGDLLKRLSDSSNKLSRGHRVLAEYITNNYDKTAFMTAAKLAEQTGVSESTVVRFGMALGFEGYPEFQKSLQELIKKKLTWVQRLCLAQSADDEEIIAGTLKADAKNLLSLPGEEMTVSIKKIVEKILNSQKIYIIGNRSSTPLAFFLYYYLNYILENVYLVSQSAGDVFGQLMHANKNDLIIGIGFPRYSSTTVNGVRFAKENGAEIAAITDNCDSPLYALADLSALVNSNMNSFVDSIVAPMSVINAIIVLVGMKKQSKLIDNFNMMEDIWAKFQVYGQAEDSGSI